MASESVESSARNSLTDLAPLSIHDRIRAMALVDSKAKEIAQMSTGAPAGESSVEAPRNSNNRSSVIDMWRQREASIVNKFGNNPSPLKKVFSERGFQHHEEKKETSSEEEAVFSTHAGSDPGASSRVVEPLMQPAGCTAGDSGDTYKWRNKKGQESQPLQSQSSSTPKTKSHQVVVSPSSPAGDSNSRNLWKNRQPVAHSHADERRDSSHGTRKVESPSPVPSRSLSFAGSQTPKSSVLQQWKSGQMLPNKSFEGRQQGSPVAKRLEVSAPQAAPITPDKDDVLEIPAFSDLKSKWAKFGASKIQARNQAKITPDILVKPNPLFGTPEEASSIDGGLNLDNNTSGVSYGPSETLQQPFLEEKKTEGTQQHAPSLVLKREDSSRQRSTIDPPAVVSAAQIAAYMYANSKPVNSTRGKSAVQAHINDDEAEVQANINDDEAEVQANINDDQRPSNKCPRKFAQRKLLLEKHRRRSRGSSNSPDREISTEISDQALDQAHDQVASEQKQQMFLNEMMKSCGSTDPNSTFMISRNVPMQTLLAYGEESEFIGSQFNTVHLPRQFSSQQTGRSDGFDPGYHVGWPTDDDDELTLQPPKTMITSRAHKVLRDKRRSFTTEPDRDDQTSARTAASGPMHAPFMSSRQASTPNAPGSNGDERMHFNREQWNPVTPRSSRIIQRPNQPSDEHSSSVDRRNLGKYEDIVRDPTIDESVSASTASNMYSATASYSDASGPRNRMPKVRRRRPRQLGVPPEAIVTDQFVSESNTNVDAFRTSFQAMSFGQIASDLTEEASSVLKGVDFKKLSTDWNQGVAAASQTLNANLSAATKSLSHLTGKDVFPRRKQLTRHHRPQSPVEEIAIEVEYVEDS